MAIWIQSGQEGGLEEGERRQPRDLGRFRFATHRLLTCNLELNVGGATHGRRGEGKERHGCYIQRNSVQWCLKVCFCFIQTDTKKALLFEKTATCSPIFTVASDVTMRRLSNASPPPQTLKCHLNPVKIPGQTTNKGGVERNTIPETTIRLQDACRI